MDRRCRYCEGGCLARGGGAYALVDTLVHPGGGLKSDALRIGVYENEGALFFEDHSSKLIEVASFLKLQTFPNVLVTGPGVFYREALTSIALMTLEKMDAFERGAPENRVA